MEDKTIFCIQCNRLFVLTAAELRRFSSRGFNVPRRCPECRKHKTKLAEPRVKVKSTSKKNKNSWKRHVAFEEDSLW
jgi:hypothetical protein